MKVVFNFGKAEWSQEHWLVFRRKLAAFIGLNWEVVQQSISTASIPPPPYKEPLMYLIYADPFATGVIIPWRKCEHMAPRLSEVTSWWQGSDKKDSERAILLIEGMKEAARLHRPLTIEAKSVE